MPSGCEFEVVLLVTGPELLVAFVLVVAIEPVPAFTPALESGLVQAFPRK